MFNKKHKKLGACLVALLSFMFLTAAAFGQGTGASLTGTVQDASGGAVPNASVVARNADTGVETRTTANDRGSYTFPSLPVGTYEISAEAPGFSRVTRNVRLNVGAQARLDLPLAVAGTVTEVEVTGAAESVILEAGASTGTVVQEEILSSVPMLANNVMELLNLMGGVTPTTNPLYAGSQQTFAGVSAGNINVSRDGVMVNEVRLDAGITSSANINQEMVGEFRMVLSPVDAEMGRGAGQVQMTTRSGSNAFHGSAVWNNQNTALDTTDFSLKQANRELPWRNLNSYILTGSGPAIKNKTFFFVTWEHQISRVKTAYTARAMSNCARVGIYRYIGGSVPTRATANNTFNPAGDTRPSVDADGNIIDRNTSLKFLPTSGPNVGVPQDYSAAHPSASRNLGGMRDGDGELQFESIFGPLTTEARNLILQDIRNTGVDGKDLPCSAFQNSSYWNPSTSTPNNPASFGVTSLWDDVRPAWDAGMTDRAGRAYRYAYDPTGFVERFTYGVDWSGGRVVMPPVNYFQEQGDGLNFASHIWTRSGVGGRQGSIFGTGGDPDRRSITFKVDHNINSNHRMSGTYTHENLETDEHEAIWPAEFGGMGGTITRRPRNFQASLTSTLRPTLLNEFRFGFMRANIWTKSSIEYNPGLQEILELLMPPSSLATNNFALIGVGEGASDFHTDTTTYNYGSHPVGGRGNISPTNGSTDTRWTFSNTVTWMKGAHSFKGGIEYRRQNSLQEEDGDLISAGWGRGFGGTTIGSVTGWPSVIGGIAFTSSGVGRRRTGMLLQHPTSAANGGTSWQNIPASGDSRDLYTGEAGHGLEGMQGLFTTPYQMMSYFAGTVGNVSQYFFMVPDPSQQYGARWNDASDPNETTFRTDTHTQEFSFFFKDDWKVNNSLTLNLGVRWEYYGVPHVTDGRTGSARTVALIGGSQNIFGASNPVDPARFMLDRSLRNYENIPFGALGDNNTLDQSVYAPITQYEYIGPGSNNSGRMAWNRDLNNFAPHLGFAWQLPWFGRGLTTLRGGWSVSYSALGQLGTFDNALARVDAANARRSTSFNGEGLNTQFGTTTHYMDLTDLARTDDAGPLPMRVRGGIMPMRPSPVGYFSGSATAYDENIKNPHTHSVNMSLTRNIGRALTVDLRYIGTFSRNQVSGINVNNNNYINSGVAAEFEKIRRDDASDPDRYQSDLINSLLPKGGYNATMAGALYNQLSGSDQIRHTQGGGGNLAQRNYSSLAGTLATGNGSYSSVTGEAGRLFRRGCLPEQRQDPNGDMTDHVGNPCLYHTPLNLFVNNPQVSSATIQSNQTKSNYHSMQTQLTMRPTHGLNFQATWTWSRNLNNNNWYNYLGEREYLLGGQHRSHALNFFGSYELPLGTRGYLLRDSSSTVKKLVEGWQISWITAIRSGTPMTSTTGNSTQWSANWPILVSPENWDDKGGNMEYIWGEDGTFVGGRYFGDNKYTRVMDPGVCNMAQMGITLYNDQCVQPNGTLRGSTRAIALAELPVLLGGDPDRQGIDPVTSAPYARLHQQSYTGADGVTYEAGTPMIVFRNATGTMGNQTFDPLSKGNYDPRRITGPGMFTLDASLSKSVEFMEGKRLEIRIDAANVLNHPVGTSADPANVTFQYGGRSTSDISTGPANMGLNATGNATFGNITTKVSHRTLQAKLRLSF